MPGKRGRRPGFRMSETHRDKIRNSNILNALVEHVEGQREMSASQVTAGIALLRKIMPDLSSTTLEGDEDNPVKVIQEIRRVVVDATRDHARDTDS